MTTFYANANVQTYIQRTFTADSEEEAKAKMVEFLKENRAFIAGTQHIEHEHDFFDAVVVVDFDGDEDVETVIYSAEHAQDIFIVPEDFEKGGVPTVTHTGPAGSTVTMRSV